MAKPKAKRKRRTQQIEEFVSYLVEIESWEWRYSFGVDPTKYTDDPYMEFKHLHVHGKPLHPRDVKAERVQLILMPDERLNEEDWRQDSCRLMGT